MDDHAPCTNVAAKWGKRRALAASIVIRAACVMAGGCSSEPAIEFDMFDLPPTQSELAEFSLGKYKIPIPVGSDRDGEARSMRNRLTFAFRLHALVEPEQESHLADVWKRHRGRIRDEVVRVCRNTSIDDLQESELATLKSHLIETLQAQLGTPGIRRLLITDVATERL